MSVLKRLVVLWALCLGLLAGYHGAPANAQAAEANANRTALVIGNSAYSFAPLVNPGNDATDVAKALEAAGFEVDLLVDASRDQIDAAVGNLGERLKTKGGVGLFFFAGHGVQVEGENYLLPIVDGIADNGELKQKAVAASNVVNTMSASRNALNIIILDACRDNPFTGGSNGLSRIESSASLFVSYSTSPGAVALDGSGRNSPYTKHLTASLAAPNLNLEETFKRTLKGVYQETQGKQTPWLSSSFFGDFIFNGDGSQRAALETQGGEIAEGSDNRNVPTLRIPDANEQRRGLGGVYRVSGTNPNGSHYRGMLTLQEAGDTYGFTWWIGKEVYRGTGELAGRMMVVDWNSTSPVVYSFLPDGVLDGEWADGSATDRLELFGQADLGATPRNGQYQVSGRNPDGSKYKGVMELDGDGQDYTLEWSIGSSSYSGRGKFADGLLVVEWGAAQPVIYALQEDGVLNGLWESGQASEIATPR